jgi:hypothetical protein
MGNSPVTLDFSKAHPIDQGTPQATAPVSLDFSKAQPISDGGAAATSDQKPGAASRFLSGALDEAGNAVAATGNAIRQTIGGAIESPQAFCSSCTVENHQSLLCDRS